MYVFVYNVFIHYCEIRIRIDMRKQFVLTIIFLIITFDACKIASSSSHTLKQGQFLNSSNFLISANKLFTLGFFIPQGSQSNDTYLGLWYTRSRIPTNNPVWIANRNEPIQGNTGVLTLTNTGNLIITHRGGDPIRLYFSGLNVNATATLTNIGNFILSDKANTTLWQSFDHPTNALLPGMKLGQNMSLTSWYNYGNPKDGAFTLEWNSARASLDLKNGGVVYWSSGALQLDGEFEYLRREQAEIYHNDSEYFIFSVDRSKLFLGNEVQWTLSYAGAVSADPSSIIFAQAELCFGYKIKKANYMELGCQVYEQPTCRNNHQNFSLRTGEFSRSRLHRSNSSYGDCRSKCWNDCDCIGFGIGSEFSYRCVIYGGENVKFDLDLTGNAPQMHVLISRELKKSSSTNLIEIFVPLSLGLLILATSCYLWRRKIKRDGEKRKRREDYFQELTASDSFKYGDEIENDKIDGHDLNFFSFQSILAATDNFSSKNKLGQGGFGPVYKGKLSDDRKIAIKRLSRTSGQGLVEFKNELILITKLQHNNLVRVLGCCIHGQEKMLIYEYMPNKSLDFFLFDQSKRALLDWQKRYNIIEGVAQGLLYLHKYSRMRVIHRDLKVSNVLLDENMNPKISDFGMARIFKQNETEAMTKRVVGTYGYMSPEYAMEGTFSIKSDVFSYGVLVLEIISGRRNASFYHLDRLFNLIGYGWNLWREGNALALMDQTLSETCVVPQVLRSIHVGLLCVQDNATDRPEMSDVVSMLSNETANLPPPKQPAFFTGKIVILSSSHQVAPNEHSINDVTITAVEPR